MAGGCRGLPGRGGEELPLTAPLPFVIQGSVASDAVEAPAAGGAKRGLVEEEASDPPPAKRIPSVNRCCICSSDPAKGAHLAPCGHLACMTCWGQEIVRTGTCPVCRAPVKKGLLRQKFMV